MFFDNKMAVSYLFTELGVVCVVVNITCCTWINTSGEVGTQLPKITDHLASESDSLSKVPLIYLSWFESWGPWLQSTLQMFGIILFSHSNSLPGALCCFKSFKCMPGAAGNQTNDLPSPGTPKIG